MKRVELSADERAAARRESKRIRELQRQERIFNSKVRTIGIDKEALQHQVQERKEREEADTKALQEQAAELIRNDLTACELERRQRKAARLNAESIKQFHQQFQQPSSRREFDLNDPDVLKKQEGVQILPGLAGEDLFYKDRTRRHQELMRDWSLQQQQELRQMREQQKLADQQDDQSRLDMDHRALQLQKMEEDLKRATKIAVRDFNQAMASENQAGREQRHRQEEESNQTDILNQLQGTLLSENAPGSFRAPGFLKPRRDCYKGMTSEERREYSEGQRQQAEERRHAVMEQRQEELQEYQVRAAFARDALMMERQQDEINKQLRRTMDQTNMQLAEAQRAQRRQENYSNIPDESFFSQFNKSSR